MWTSVAYVSGGFSLVAFLAATSAFAYRAKLQRDIEEVKSAPKGERAKLILVRHGVIDEKRHLTENRLQWFLENSKASSRRHLVNAFVVVVLSFVLALLSAYAVYRLTISTRNINVQLESAQEILRERFGVELAIGESAATWKYSNDSGILQLLDIPHAASDVVAFQADCPGYQLAYPGRSIEIIDNRVSIPIELADAQFTTPKDLDSHLPERANIRNPSAVVSYGAISIQVCNSLNRPITVALLDIDAYYDVEEGPLGEVFSESSPFPFRGYWHEDRVDSRDFTIFEGFSEGPGDFLLYGRSGNKEWEYLGRRQLFHPEVQVIHVLETPRGQLVISDQGETCEKKM